MKFIHTADIHLDSPLHRLEVYEGAPVDEIRQASRRAFENLVDLAIDEAVDFVLIAGDLFDGDWRDYNTGLYFIKQVSRLKKVRIKVFIISGNHDADGKMTRSLPYPDNVHVFSSKYPGTQIMDDINVAIHGQSFASGAVMDNLAANYPEPIPGHFNIGLLHTSLTGREGHQSYAPCSLDDLTNRGYDYWALGHVHRFEVAAPYPPVVFCGCLQGRHIRETGAKGCLLVTVEAESPPEMDRQDVDVIRWERVRVDLNGVASEDEMLERFKTDFGKVLARHDSKPVVARVEFSGRSALHDRLVADPEHLKESIRSSTLVRFGERAWIEKVNVRTRPEARAAADPGPLRELDLLVEDLLADDRELLAVGKTLSALFQKLPQDYRRGDARIRPDDPEHLRRLVAQAHALLMHKLKQEDVAS